MKLSVLIISFFTGSLLYAQSKDIALIPEPVSIKRSAGQFLLPQTITVDAPANSELKTAISFLKERLSTATGAKVTLTNNAPDATIHLQLYNTANKAIGKEGYQLTVTNNTIFIKANEPAGIFYGIQTLLQLFPKEIESAKQASGVRWELPSVEIIDYPRFGWRGLMFDVARHFFTKEDVKQFIDQMVRYKYNLLHFHLSDDEGWRIEIKGLPKLTEVGAWNVKKVGYFGRFSKPEPTEPRNYGGYYTQQDIKEIVQYAKERFVNVMPEIDVPGHSLAAISSYPELSCTAEAVNYKVRSGEQIMDWSKGAPPLALVDNTLCPANEKVYPFLDTIITQLAQLFPFEYIHMGGDECPKNFWEKSEAIKALMKREGLKNMEEVQSYFTKRVQKIVASKGKKMIGWDEIVEGGLAPNVGVMSWNGAKPGIEASRLGHEVVMTPSTHVYIDLMQGDPAIEPPNYASVRLSKSYEFDPIPEGADPKFIKGGQANLWTEQVYNVRHLQYMLWPRGLAISESLWSPKEKKNWNQFFNRMEKHFSRFDVADIKYAPSVYDPIVTVSKNANKEVQIKLGTEAPGLDIYYSFDNSFPDDRYPKYKEPIVPPKDALALKLITYRGKTPVGRMMVIPVEELKSRADKNKNYP